MCPNKILFTWGNSLTGTRVRMIAGLIGLILLAAAFWQTGLPDGLELVRLGANDILLEFIDNLGGLDGSRPLELVGLIRKIPYAQRVLG